MTFYSISTFLSQVKYFLSWGFIARSHWKEKEWKTAWMGDAMKLQVKILNSVQTLSPGLHLLSLDTTCKSGEAGQHTWWIHLTPTHAEAEQTHELLHNCTHFSLSFSCRKHMVSISAGNTLREIPPMVSIKCSLNQRDVLCILLSH